MIRVNWKTSGSEFDLQAITCIHAAFDIIYGSWEVDPEEEHADDANRSREDRGKASVTTSTDTMCCVLYTLY